VRYDLELGEPYVPGILMVPHTHPAPAALLLHGLGSRKERMADTVGQALLRRGVAALAVDLPHHGARSEQGLDVRSIGPMRLVGVWRSAVAEARAALEYLRTRDDIDGARLGIVGYSLGSFLANVVAADDPDVGPVVLAAGGDLPDGIPFESMVRAAVNPLRAVRALEGRPLLMINGRYDRTVTSAQAKRLFDAAAEPKTIRWYNGGHWPPESEIDSAADWLSAQLQSIRARPRRPRTTASSGE
jgi:dienelactone hydrolase